MAKPKGKKPPQFKTPVCDFLYTHLNKPDYGSGQYKSAEGTFSVTCVFDKDDPEFQAFAAEMAPLEAKLEDIAAEGFASVSGKTKAMYRKKGITEPTVMPFFTEEVDDEGLPTGRVMLRIKTKAVFKGRDGKPVKKVVTLVDGKGEVIPANKRPVVYAGTRGRVAFGVGLTFIEGTAEAYMSAYMNQVQITKLVTGSGGSSAFGAVDDSDFDADDLDEYEEPDNDDADADDDSYDAGADDDLDDEIPF